jgi:uncharacterized RDD family membrane protein YckC
MNKFLLSSVWSRAKVFAVASLIFLTCWYTFLAISNVDRLNIALLEFQKWNSGQGAVCERIFADVTKEVAAIDLNGCEREAKEMSIPNVYLPGAARAFDQCRKTNETKRAELIRLVTSSDCPKSSALSNYYKSLGARAGDVPDLIPPAAPAGLLLFSIGRDTYQEAFVAIFTIFIALTLALLALSDFLRRGITETHKGWMRVTISVPALCGAATVAWWTYEGEDLSAAALAGVISIAVIAATLVYGRSIVCWVFDGFLIERDKRNFIETRLPNELHTERGSVASSSKLEPSDAGSTQGKDEKIKISTVKAKFWSRLWARCIDLSICWLFVSICFEFLPDLRSALPGKIGIFVDILMNQIFICGSILLYEVFFLTRFGATPGKMLFGITVLSIDGGMPTHDASRIRTWTLFKSGLFFCFLIPVFQFVGAYRAWKRKDFAQLWDLAARTHTVQKPLGPLRFTTVAAFAFCLFSALVVISKASKENTKKEIFQAIRPSNM